MSAHPRWRRLQDRLDPGDSDACYDCGRPLDPDSDSDDCEWCDHDENHEPND